jgi:hypothetical protein
MGFKNEPDPRGEQRNPFSLNTPTDFNPNMPLASQSLLFDSKSKKFIVARDDEEAGEDKKEDGVPELNDTYVSEKEFKQIPMVSTPDKIVVDISDETCSLHPDEVEHVCIQLCIDG